jgi:hypothetical protein
LSEKKVLPQKAQKTQQENAALRLEVSSEFKL